MRVHVKVVLQHLACECMSSDIFNTWSTVNVSRLLYKACSRRWYGEIIVIDIRYGGRGCFWFCCLTRNSSTYLCGPNIILGDVGVLTDSERYCVHGAACGFVHHRTDNCSGRWTHCKWFWWLVQPVDGVNQMVFLKWIEKCLCGRRFSASRCKQLIWSRQKGASVFLTSS